MPRTEPAAAMRADRHFAQRVLLRAGARESGEPRLDAAVGRTVSGTSGVWEPALDGGLAPGGPAGQSQTGGATARVNGPGGRLPERLSAVEVGQGVFHSVPSSLEKKSSRAFTGVGHFS